MNHDEVLKALDAALTKMQKGGRYTPEDVDELEKCAMDALDLLRAHKPRVMSRDEVFGSKVIEYRYDGATDGSFGPGTVVEEHPLNAVVDVVGYGDNEKGTTCVEFCGYTNDHDDLLWQPVDEYGKTWRCWTSRPTDEQREAVKWNE